MLIKVNYAGGYSNCIDSKRLTSVSWTEYANFQFQGDEYSLNCESIEIAFCSTLMPNYQEQITKVRHLSPSFTQRKKSLQSVGK